MSDSDTFAEIEALIQKLEQHTKALRRSTRHTQQRTALYKEGHRSNSDVYSSSAASSVASSANGVRPTTGSTRAKTLRSPSHAPKLSLSQRIELVHGVQKIIDHRMGINPSHSLGASYSQLTSTERRSTHFKMLSSRYQVVGDDAAKALKSATIALHESKDCGFNISPSLEARPGGATPPSLPLPPPMAADPSAPSVESPPAPAAQGGIWAWLKGSSASSAAAAVSPGAPSTTPADLPPPPRAQGMTDENNDDDAPLPSARRQLAQLQKPSTNNDDFVEFDKDKIDEETKREFRLIAEEMRETAEVAHHINEMTQQQEARLAEAEARADTASAKTVAGRKELTTAARYKMTSMVIGGAIMGGIVAGPVGFMAGAKTAGGVAACVMAGGATGAVASKKVADVVNGQNRTMAIEADEERKRITEGE